mmetsp:Transcript_15840/g.47627  ORF Transcript_15840/g.47627 Transcript_15840/m.47627 type:complete len:208 (-) Transcript_15840:561-1184(-)
MVLLRLQLAVQPTDLSRLLRGDRACAVQLGFHRPHLAAHRANARLQHARHVRDQRHARLLVPQLHLARLVRRLRCFLVHVLDARPQPTRHRPPQRQRIINRLRRAWRAAVVVGERIWRRRRLRWLATARVLRATALARERRFELENFVPQLALRRLPLCLRRFPPSLLPHPLSLHARPRVLLRAPLGLRRSRRRSRWWGRATSRRLR